MSLSLLEHEIASYEKLAYSLHEEEKAIGSMRERLHRFEDQIRTVQSGERSLTEDQAEWLQRLFTEVVQLQSSLELSPDRQCAFDRIEQAMHYLSEIHSHGKSSFSANMQLLYKTESGSDINLSMSLGN